MYQRVSPPSHTWLKETTNAPRSRLFRGKSNIKGKRLLTAVSVVRNTFGTGGHLQSEKNVFDDGKCGRVAREFIKRLLLRNQSAAHPPPRRRPHHHPRSSTSNQASSPTLGLFLLLRSSALALVRPQSFSKSSPCIWLIRCGGEITQVRGVRGG